MEALEERAGPLSDAARPILGLLGLPRGLPPTGRPPTSGQVSVGRMAQAACHHATAEFTAPAPDNVGLMPFRKTSPLCNHVRECAHSWNTGEKNWSKHGRVTVPRGDPTACVRTDVVTILDF